VPLDIALEHRNFKRLFPSAACTHPVPCSLPMRPDSPPAAAGVCPQAQRHPPCWCARRGAETPRAPGRHSPAAPARSGAAAWQVARRHRPAAWRERRTDALHLNGDRLRGADL
jgi:hypothetical protein